MPRLAAIDIGTNSVKMTVADANAGGLVLLSEQARTTRLGAGIDQTKRLDDLAIDRTYLAIEEFVRAARSLGATRIAATGTSALRDATNGHVLSDRVRQGLAVVIEIIAGNREAELAYRAVASDSAFGSEEPLLIFDIGGGSTELTCGMGPAVTAHRSLNIGAVRLTERYLRSDPPTTEEYAAARVDAKNEISDFTGCGERAGALSGVGGTAVNVAAVVHGERDVHGKSVSRAQLGQTVRLFLESTLAERKLLPGLEPERADIILGGTAILEELLDRYQANSLRVSVRGMRYGLLAEMAQAG